MKRLCTIFDTLWILNHVYVFLSFLKIKRRGMWVLDLFNRGVITFESQF